MSAKTKAFVFGAVIGAVAYHIVANNAPKQSK